jgi:hypothetical protein
VPTLRADYAMFLRFLGRALCRLAAATISTGRSRTPHAEFSSVGIFSVVTVPAAEGPAQ